MIVNIDIKLKIKLISLTLIKYIFYFNYFKNVKNYNKDIDYRGVISVFLRVGQNFYRPRINLFKIIYGLQSSKKE